MRRHAASLLSNGDLGWIQTATFLLTGVAVTAAALGLRRVLAGHPEASTGFLAAVLGITSGSGSASAGVTLSFWAAIACSFAWLAGTCRWAASHAARAR